jgi:hypothetical protein
LSVLQALGQQDRQPHRLGQPPERHRPADEAAPGHRPPANQVEPGPNPLGEHDQPQVGAGLGRVGDGATEGHEQK